MSDTTITVATADFDARVLNAGRPVLVDFWADWCGPCKALAPVLDDVAEDYRGAVEIAKVDIVAEEELAVRFGVRNIPLLVLFKDGKEVARSVGSMTRARLSAFLDGHL